MEPSNCVQGEASEFPALIIQCEIEIPATGEATGYLPITTVVYELKTLGAAGDATSDPLTSVVIRKTVDPTAGPLTVTYT